MKFILASLIALALFASFSNEVDAKRRRLNLEVVDSIAVNETDIHIGDSVTFTTTGSGLIIHMSCFSGTGGAGYRYGFFGEIDSVFVLDFASGFNYSCWAWLDDNRDLSDGHLAVTRFYVTQ